MGFGNPRLAELSDDDRQVLDSWLVEFDQGWDAGLLANRFEQIPPGSSWRLPALAEMVKIDLQRQWERGRQVSLESYLAEFPELGSPGNVSADLIQAEYEVRRQFGVPATLEDYVRRFPHQAGELAHLIAQGGSALSRPPSAVAVSRSSSHDQKSAKAPEPPPEQFGRYRIIKRLGQGGMGSVYLAQDTHLERPVALKIPDFGNQEDPEARKRFLEEVRTAATLRHPYLCPVYDAGEIAGQPYLTMGYIPGQSLAALIGDEGWPQRQVAALVGKLALAMQEAHTKKVVHRDLKPANVMIKTTGQRREPVIVDFGLARRDKPEDQRLTRSGQLMGTLGYMAPEQIRGDLKEIGPPCDIYALGVILYELLTGRLPFSGSGLAVAGQILTLAPLPPSAHRSTLDPALEAICLKAMAKAIGGRYGSMAELAAALTGWLQSPSASLTPPTLAVSPAAPSAGSGERPHPGGSNSLVGQFLAELVGTQASPVPVPSQEPVVPGAMLRKRRKRVRPIFIWAAVLGATLLGVIVFVATDNRRATMVVNRGDNANLKVDNEPTRKAEDTEGPDIPPGRESKPGVGADPSVSRQEIRNTIGMRLVLIQPGEFLMGSRYSDEDAEIDEQPQHRVRITRPFYLGVHEVTRGQFRRFVDETGYKTEAEKNDVGGFGYDEPSNKLKQYRKFNWLNSGFEQTDEHPVVNVSWNDSVAFSEWLSRKESRRYRLPTEAEWEYACRAGTKTRYQTGNAPEGLAAVGNVADGTAKQKFPEWQTIAAQDGVVFTAPVGQYQANGFGLYDMHGNVWEWCSDWYGGDYYKRSPVDDPRGPAVPGERVLRGGGWGSNPRRHCRSAHREKTGPDDLDSFGFRLALESPEQESVSSQPGFVPLFNGKDLSGWVRHPGQPGRWRVENGILIGSGVDWSMLWTERNDYRDFHLRVEARINEGGDSGVFFRGRESEGYQAQLVGKDPKKHQGGTGSLMSHTGTAIVDFREPLVSPDQWFWLEVIADGDKILIKVNGKTTAQYIDANRPSRSSSVGLEQCLPATVIEFRKIEVKELNRTAGAAGGLPAGRAQAVLGMRPNIDPSRYIDIQLIASCSGPQGEIFEGAWWALAGPKSTIKPHVPPGTFSMSSGGYLGTAAHVTGARALGGAEYASFGIMMPRDRVTPFDASRYHGISFYAKADKPMEIQVCMGQQNFVRYGNHPPKLAVTVGTAWSRYVAPFDALLSDPLPGGGRVPVTPASVLSFGFAMPVGAFDFWVDEIYFVREAEKVQGTVLASAGSTKLKPVGPTSVGAAGSPASIPEDKPRISQSADSRGQAGSTGPPSQIINSIGIKLVLIPGGTFLMGSPEDDKVAKGDEKPQHPVRIKQPFYLGVTEVTRGQFRRFVAEDGYRTEAEKDGKGGEGWNEERNRFEISPRYFWQNPGFDQTDEHPVVNVTWNDAVAFVNWLSRKENRKYRLPTEAEWEYACRAGTTTRYSYGDNPAGLVAVANVKDGTAKEKHPDWGTNIAARDGYVYSAPVGQFRANAFGLYDMHGNAEEWCSDGYYPDYYRQSPVVDPPGASGTADQVLRGGGWFNVPSNNRSAGRWRAPPNTRTNWRGFRLALAASGP